MSAAIIPCSLCIRLFREQPTTLNLTYVKSQALKKELFNCVLNNKCAPQIIFQIIFLQSKKIIDVSMRKS